MRRTTHITFGDGEYIYKVPSSDEAAGFYQYEARITNALPVEDDVAFPRIDVHEGNVPILRYRAVPGSTLMEISRRPASLLLHHPPGIPAILGKAVAMLHACDLEADLWRVLDDRRKDAFERYERVFTRQAKFGTITWEHAKETTGFLSELDGDAFVLCHGDLNLKNVIVAPDFTSSQRIGIIDFGKVLRGPCELDFAILRVFVKNFRNGEQFLRESVAAYQERSGHALDTELADKFSALLFRLRDIKKIRRGE